MKGRTLFAVLGGLVLVAACLLACFCRPQSAAKSTDDGAKAKSGGSIKLAVGAKPADSIDAMRQVVKSHVGKQNVRARMSRGDKPVVVSSMFGRLADADRGLCEAVQAAMDADDFSKTVELCARLKTSSDPAARAHAVDALGWFGAEALPELTMLMWDPDADVAQSAVNAWESGFSEIDSPADRLKISKLAMNVLSSKDALQSIGSKFSIAATDYIDAEDDEDAAFGRRVEVVQNVVDMIYSSNDALSNVGLELYDEITGHEWISMSEAERYLGDPDNYEPPESLDDPDNHEQPEE